MTDRQRFRRSESALGGGLVWPKTTLTFWHFHVLKANGEVIVRKDVWGIPANEMASDAIKMPFLDFDARVLTKIGDHLKEFDPMLADLDPAPDWIFEGEAELDEPEQPETVFKEEEDLHTSEAYDQWLTATILVERGGPQKRATVIGRKKDHNGNPIGRYHNNTRSNMKTGRWQLYHRTLLRKESTLQWTKRVEAIPY
jgi:hypothetical protein